MNKEIAAGAFIDLFSGIGGFALAAFRARLRFARHSFSEVDDFAIGVYRKRFPQAESLGDVRDIDWGRRFVGRASLVCGGFPCQPHSIVGRRRGGADERDLWTECARALRDLRPAVALFENVPALLVSDGGRFFNRVLSDISTSGYDAEWQIISAGEAGAPHLRKRLWLVAYP
ncbi:MAG: DNA (cytosine-5-)-methyltransferase, partial [Treponema sp.]|nr:DNA (cytosine-5-)-methyltransferase [Treponema sp.]